MINDMDFSHFEQGYKLRESCRTVAEHNHLIDLLKGERTRLRKLFQCSVCKQRFASDARVLLDKFPIEFARPDDVDVSANGRGVHVRCVDKDDPRQPGRMIY